jgi:hypothetical protein
MKQKKPERKKEKAGCVKLKNNAELKLISCYYGTPLKPFPIVEL